MWCTVFTANPLAAHLFPTRLWRKPAILPWQKALQLSPKQNTHKPIIMLTIAQIQILHLLKIKHMFWKVIYAKSFYCCLLALFFLGACRQQTAEEVEDSALASKAPLHQEALIKAMAADRQVQSFILNTEHFLNTYDSWYAALTPAQKEAYDQKSKQASRTGNLIEEEFMLPAQIASYHSRQEALAAAIKSRYPELYALDADQQRHIKRIVRTRILAQNSSLAGN